MLGTLAKWLRILGFDTYFVNSDINDDKIIEISKKEKRILISRDKELIQRARKDKLKTIELKTIDIDEQINTVLNEVPFDKTKVLSRCILCNTLIKKIKKDEIEKKVPPKVFEKQNEFWFCSKCDKIYWKGSHYEKMIEKIIKLS